MVDYDKIAEMAEGLKVHEQLLADAIGTPGEAAARKSLLAHIEALNSLEGMRAPDKKAVQKVN